ncbi:MAG: OmpA family protein [Pseudomonadota bacterium]
MARRFFFLVPVLALPFSACVTKGAHNETLAENIQLSSNLGTLQKERDTLKAQLDDATKKLSALETRNEELSNTNQMLVGKNADYARKSTEVQQELLKRQQEGMVPEEQKQFFSKTYDELLKGLRTDIAAGEVKIVQDTDHLTIQIAYDALFSPANLKILANGQKLLKRVASVLKTKEKQIQVGTYVDDGPIPAGIKKTFPSGWELSADRAAHVARFLEDNDVNAARLAAIGYGTHRPIAANDTADGRKKNRRIEIVLTSISNAPSKKP